MQYLPLLLCLFGLVAANPGFKYLNHYHHGPEHGKYGGNGYGGDHSPYDYRSSSYGGSHYGGASYGSDNGDYGSNYGTEYDSSYGNGYGYGSPNHYSKPFFPYGRYGKFSY